jgi:hypothetical protein
MWAVVTTGVVTLIIMVLLHSMYNHLQSTLTVPKVADLVHAPEQKYKEIDILIGKKEEKPNKEMKQELNAFLLSLRQQKA